MRAAWIDGSWMSKPTKRRALERLRHDDRGRSESAPHVGNARPRPQLLDYAIQGR
jgi:hypothetical protein